MDIVQFFWFLSRFVLFVFNLGEGIIIIINFFGADFLDKSVCIY